LNLNLNAGERLRKDIYEALRNGKGWNETAFIFTWDDPGGAFFLSQATTSVYLRNGQKRSVLPRRAHGQHQKRTRSDVDPNAKQAFTTM